MQSRRIYFARPISVYGTPLDDALLQIIRDKWKGDTIVNPADPEHEEVVKKIKEHDPDANVMDYFSDLVKTCDEVVALPFMDGMWGKGVYTEAEAVLDWKNGKYVWVIDPQTHVIRFVPKLNPALCLSVDETRARVRNPDRSSRPYA